jgi:hypothetical protein
LNISFLWPLEIDVPSRPIAPWVSNSRYPSNRLPGSAPTAGGKRTKLVATRWVVLWRSGGPHGPRYRHLLDETPSALGSAFDWASGCPAGTTRSRTEAGRRPTCRGVGRSPRRSSEEQFVGTSRLTDLPQHCPNNWVPNPSRSVPGSPAPLSRRTMTGGRGTEGDQVARRGRRSTDLVMRRSGARISLRLHGQEP